MACVLIGLAAGPALAAPAPPVAAAPPAPLPLAVQQIQQTERAFAQAVAALGVAPGFRQYAAPDAVMFIPDPGPAAVALAKAGKGNAELLWRPQYIGVSPAGDLGFAMGPSVYKQAGAKPSGGFYLSIWKHMPDGGWRFALDHGVDMPPAIFAAPAQPLSVVATDVPPAPHDHEGIREADGAVNVALPRDARSAFADRLDDQVILVRTDKPPAVGRRRALRLVRESPPIQEAYTLGAAVSADGGFGYTYGRARWSTPSGPQPAYYVRVWRLTPLGWRLLADHLAER